ncbi:hypothetical protein, partial [Leuconostoc mesenteroides]|uniref:hypothetical protein n=1 Tax=Leuconostoc mesenteroides TaxID=1245 RepID=UPI0021A6ABC0
LSIHNIKKLLYLIISDYALEIKQSGFSVYEHLFPAVFLKILNTIWLAVMGIEILLAWFCYYSGKRVVIWAFQIKNNIQAHCK